MSKIKYLFLALLLSLSGAASAQSTKAQFKAILDQFCQSYYEDAFGGKQYIEGSLSVTSVESDESGNVIKIKGKHSYRGKYIPFYGRKTHSSVDFKAEVTEARNGLRIKFWKWYEADLMASGHWEGPCEKIIVP